MASLTVGRVRKLREFLSEEQEPFTLETYLSEKRKELSKVTSSRLFSKASVALSLKEKSGSEQCCSRSLKAALGRISTVNGLSRITNSEKKENCSNPEILAAEDEVLSSRGSDCVSSAPSPSSQASEVTHLREVDRDGHPERRCFEESKQGSPVSVLEGAFCLSSENPIGMLRQQHERNTRHTKCSKVTEESVLSASLWKILASTDKIEENVSSLKTKKILQQQNQLLLDLVREGLEERRRKRGNQRFHRHELVGLEEIGKMVGERLRMLNGEAGKDRSELEMEQSWFSWLNLETVKKEVAWEVADSVLEAMEGQIVMELAVPWNSRNT